MAPTFDTYDKEVIVSTLDRPQRSRIAPPQLILPLVGLLAISLLAAWLVAVSARIAERTRPRLAAAERQRSGPRRRAGRGRRRSPGGRGSRPDCRHRCEAQLLRDVTQAARIPACQIERIGRRRTQANADTYTSS